MSISPGKYTNPAWMHPEILRGFPAYTSAWEAVFRTVRKMPSILPEQTYRVFGTDVVYCNLATCSRLEVGD